MYNSVTHFINIAVPPWTFFFFFSPFFSFFFFSSTAFPIQVSEVCEICGAVLGGSVFGKTRCWEESPGTGRGDWGVCVWRWHHGGGDTGSGCCGEAEGQCGLLPPSLAKAEELFQGKGFSFFLCKPALREDESLPAWVASRWARGGSAGGALAVGMRGSRGALSRGAAVEGQRVHPVQNFSVPAMISF